MEFGKNRGEGLPPGDGSSLALWRAAAFARWMAVSLVAAAFFTALAAQEPAGDSEAYLNRLEWRGVLALPGEVRFSLHDKAGEGSFWVGLEEIRSGIEVVSYDPKENRVTLRHGEATRTLSMSSSAIVDLPEEPLPAVAEPADELLIPEASEPLDEAARERLSGLWQEAMDGSSDLTEIDQAVRALNRDRETLEARIEQMEQRIPDLPEAPTDEEMRARAVAEGVLQYLESRQNGLIEEQLRLTEGALAVLQNSPGISDESRRELAAGLQGGFLSHLAPPRDPEHATSGEAASPDGR